MDRGGMIKDEIRIRELGLQFAKRRNIAEHPESASIGGNCEVVFFHNQIGHGCARQI